MVDSTRKDPISIENYSDLRLLVGDTTYVAAEMSVLSKPTSLSVTF